MSNEKSLQKRKTFQLRLTKFELLHIRDLFSIVTPPEVNRTVSQHLAEVENRVLVESMLWKKLSNLCEEAGIPTGDDAPDFVVAPTAAPPIGVFRLASEPQDEQDEGGIEFVDGDEDEEEDEEEAQ
jgi:hypothetical protein